VTATRLGQRQARPAHADASISAGTPQTELKMPFQHAAASNNCFMIHCVKLNLVQLTQLWPGNQSVTFATRAGQFIVGERFADRTSAPNQAVSFCKVSAVGCVP